MALERSATIKPDCAATVLITVLISGRGSNLKSLIENQNGYRVAAVVSNNPQAAGLELAAHYKIPSFIVARESYSSLAEFKAGVLAAVMETNPDFVALAGFMMMLSPQFIAEFEGRLINIHPSLLPELSGLNTHARAVSAGVKRHGCSCSIPGCFHDWRVVIFACMVARFITRQKLSVQLMSADLLYFSNNIWGRYYDNSKHHLRRTLGGFYRDRWPARCYRSMA